MRGRNFPAKSGFLKFLVGMMHRYLGALVLLMLVSDSSGAQVIPGDSVSPNLGAAVANSRSRPLLGISSPTQYRERPEDDIAYNKAIKGIPDRKPAKDPWASVRQTPAAATVDRHRIQ
jgi:hypothetical protein